MRRSRSKVSFGAPPSPFSSRNFEPLPVPQVALRAPKPRGDSAIRTTHKSDRHVKLMASAADYLLHDASTASVIVAVFSGMTVADGPVSESRGSRRPQVCAGRPSMRERR
jgi:hypothetical protein